MPKEKTGDSSHTENLAKIHAPNAAYTRVQAKFLIDGHCLYDRCKRVAKIRRNRTLDIFKWANLKTPNLPIDVELLVDVARELLSRAISDLERRYQEKLENNGHVTSSSSDLFLAQLSTRSNKFKSQSREERLRKTSVIIESEYEGEIFVGKASDQQNNQRPLCRQSRFCSRVYEAKS